MLWYKGWLETRWRFLFFTGVMIVSCAAFGSRAPAHEFPGNAGGVRYILYYFVWPVMALLLAGAGINSQTVGGTFQGVHPSMYFTLSLPVTRRRLVAVRAALGAVETLALIALSCGAAWAFTPLLRERGAVLPMLTYVAASTVGASVAYSASVLLATFLDEIWQFYVGCLALGAIWVCESRLLGLHPPPFGQVDWPLAAFSLVAAAALLAAAFWKASRTQY